MEYLGKKILRYGDIEFIGDEYLLPIGNDLWNDLLLVSTKQQLEGILEDQIRNEDFNAANQVKDAIEKRFPIK